MSRNRILCFFTALLCALSFAPRACAESAEPELASEAAILMDASTGQILYAKNAWERLYPASITKVLTGLLALENLESTDTLTVSQTAVSQVPRTSSHISLQPGETLTVADAMYALAISSANDAAVTLAEGVSGSVEAFSTLMNEKARECGALNSNFVNPSGLPSQQHYTTAYDMAKIAAKALENPDFLLYFGSGAYEMPATNLSQARSLISKNQMTDGTRSCPGLLFSKTGWTTSAQGTLVTAARQSGVTLIAVTLKSPMLEDKYQDTQALLEYGFANYKTFRVEEDFVLTQLEAQGLDRAAELTDFEPFTILIPQDTQEVRVIVPGGVDPDSGVTTLPISVAALREDGSETIIRDGLLPLNYAEKASAQAFAPAQSDAAVSAGIHFQPWPLVFGALLLGAVEWILRKRRQN